MIPADPAEQHRRIAATFADRTRGVGPGGWDAPTPVADWTARDVVAHLIDWFPGFLAGGCDVVLPPAPPVDDDPAASWTHRAAAVQALLDAPDTSERTFAHPHLPPSPLDAAIAQYYTADVFMHTWDLARATGQPDELDASLCLELYTGMAAMGDALRVGGQYGPPVPVPDDADPQSRLLGHIGRDPAWRPPR